MFWCRPLCLAAVTTVCMIGKCSLSEREPLPQQCFVFALYLKLSESIVVVVAREELELGEASQTRSTCRIFLHMTSVRQLEAVSSLVVLPDGSALSSSPRSLPCRPLRLVVSSTPAPCVAGIRTKRIMMAMAMEMLAHGAPPLTLLDNPKPTRTWVRRFETFCAIVVPSVGPRTSSFCVEIATSSYRLHYLCFRVHQRIST